MSTKKKDKRFSVGISEFCKLVDAAKRDYDWNSEEVNRLDKLTQDYLHQLELDGLDYRGRAKVATKIAECRRTRRTRKDVVEVLEPLVEFLNSDKGNMTKTTMTTKNIRISSKRQKRVNSRIC